MSKAITKDNMALLKEASETFNETVVCLASTESKCQLRG
jgi:glycerol-3-phosphate cytidylyltransferase-like family protein